MVQTHYIFFLQAPTINPRRGGGDKIKYDNILYKNLTFNDGLVGGRRV